jgi:hypothetical protein
VVESPPSYRSPILRRTDLLIGPIQKAVPVTTAEKKLRGGSNAAHFKQRMVGCHNSGDPQYWTLISDDDKAVYRRISTALSAPTSRNKRNRRIEDFQAILDALEVFQNSDTDDKWKRCLVCGICRLPRGIAVNTTQLKHLVFKCKSSINGALKGLGYNDIITGPAASEELLREIPYLRDNPAELRRWTIRTSSAPQTADRPSDVTPPVVDHHSSDSMVAVGFEASDGFHWHGGCSYDLFPGDFTF